MSEILINYDELVQEALRSVVKTVLKNVEKDGLPGEHHFYIAFKTHAEGVEISPHLKSRYPDEMTIVLQHRYWGLKIDEDQFEIGLSFNQKPELLVIPYAAIVGFVDPSVSFALQFNEDSEEQSEDALEFEADADAINEVTIELANEESAQATQKTKKKTKKNTKDNDESGVSNVVTLDAFRNKS